MCSFVLYCRIQAVSAPVMSILMFILQAVVGAVDKQKVHDIARSTYLKNQN